MTDLNPNVPDRPIEVAATPVPAQAATGSRDILLLLAALPALIALLGTGDVIAIVRWFGSEPGLALIGLIVAIATPIWRQWLARKQHTNQLRMAGSAPDTVAIVKGTSS